METSHFTFTLRTEKSPQEVFQAVNNVRGWWTGYYSEEITGGTAALNDEFIFRAADGAHYTKQKIVETVPGKKVVWLITHAELTFLEKKDEWLGTKIIFDISKKDGKTQLVFTHEGLTPQVECYNACAPAWSEYLQNRLLPLINQGQ